MPSPQVPFSGLWQQLAECGSTAVLAGLLCRLIVCNAGQLCTACMSCKPAQMACCPTHLRSLACAVTPMVCRAVCPHAQCHSCRPAASSHQRLSAVRRARHHGPGPQLPQHDDRRWLPPRPLLPHPGQPDGGCGQQHSSSPACMGSAAPAHMPPWTLQQQSVDGDVCCRASPRRASTFRAAQASCTSRTAAAACVSSCSLLRWDGPVTRSLRACASLCCRVVTEVSCILPSQAAQLPAPRPAHHLHAGADGRFDRLLHAGEQHILSMAQDWLPQHQLYSSASLLKRVHAERLGHGTFQCFPVQA